VLRVVLYEPEIPQNVGNIARSAAATASELHLIRPFGFRWGDPRLKRAGLDYWPHVRYFLHNTWDDFLQALPADARVWAFSTKAQRTLYQARFGADDFLLFGPETRGLPAEVLERFAALRIPMPGPVRSLNLAVSVAVALYEALRQSASW